jgi:hypothetical protein
MTHSEASRTFKGLVFLALVVAGLMLACAGCNTLKDKRGDTYPDGWEQMCLEERANAHAWYVNKYHKQPIVPVCDVVMVDEPTGKLWGLITYYQPRYLIQIWRDAPRRATLFHEFKHSLEYKNNRDSSEQAIKRKGRIDSDSTPVGSI